MLFSTPPEDPTRFAPLLVVMILAFVVPLALARLRRVPIVVGEIVFGILVGPSLLGWVTDGPILTFISDIGLAFLMFLAGMEINFNLIFNRSGSPEKKNGPNTLLVSGLIYLFTVILAFIGAFVLGRVGLEGDLWLITFVLSATSLGVLLPILKEQKMLSSPFGQIIFITATLADFLTVLLLTVHLVLTDRGFDLEIFSLLLLFLAFFFFYQFGSKLIRLPRARELIEDLTRATVQIKVRGALAIMMTFVVLAEFIEAELILGAFLAGMIISILKRPEDDALIHNLEAFGYGFFIPVFFIMVGVDLDIGSLVENPDALLILPWLFLIALVVKLVPMLAAKRHFSWRDLLAGGLLLNTHLSLEVAVAVVGLRAGLFNSATSTTVILFAVITVLIMPLLYNLFAPEPEKEEPSFKLIAGVTELSLRVADQLRAHGDAVRFITADPAEVQQLKQQDFRVMEITPDEIHNIPTHRIETVMVLTEDDHINLEISRAARKMNVNNIIAMVKHPSHLQEFENLGVKPYSPAVDRSTMLTMMARNPDALSLLTSTTDDRDTCEAQMENPKLLGTLIRNLDLPGSLLILAIRRGDDLLIPHGNTSLEMDDTLTLLGRIEDLRAAQGMFEIG